MKRREAIALVMAAEGIPDTMRAGAVVAISLAPKEQFQHFAAFADQCLTLVKSGDYEGALAVLDEAGLDDPDMRSYIQSVIGEIRAGRFAVPSEERDPNTDTV